MRAKAIFVLAWRESRTARRRLLLYMSSIFLGVAALVAIDSFAENVTSSVREQSRALLGGDLSIASRAPLPGAVRALLDTLAVRDSVQSADLTTFASMAVVPRTTLTRLAQVRAVSPGYPFYGEITTQPEGRLASLHQGRNVIVDPSLLVSLDARVGDTLALGNARFVIAGTVENTPGETGITSAISPRVYMSDRWIPETGLLVFGSRAEYETLLKLPPMSAAQQVRFLARYRPRLEPADAQPRIRMRTVAENEFNLTDAIDDLRRFLGIVGLVALLLGGLGVASGVHAFVMRKIDTVAILRCVGATSGQVLGIYVLQAAAMGLVGATAGALLGVGIQLALPGVMAELLPVDVRVRVAPMPILLGLGVGLWVALVFALRPLVALRRISPLQALRRESDATVMRATRWAPAPMLISVATVASVVAIATSRADTLLEGVLFAAGVGAAVLVLWASAALLVSQARRIARPGWPFTLRQGIANLYRPGNQTRVVALALGFGVFLMSTLYQVQDNLLRTLTVRLEQSRANVVFFDVQADQRDGVDSLIRAGGHEMVQQAPIVPMRIASINGRTIPDLQNDSSPERRAAWALRREYRSTYRSTTQPSETITKGRWFGTPDGDDVYEASFEQELAEELQVGIGDTVTWNVQGVPVTTVITSLREVNWARFETNFFVVTEPAALERAPQQFVLLAHAPSPQAIAQLQRSVVRVYPSVSSIDLTLVQQTVGNVLGKVVVAIRFLAILSLALGIPVLFSAVSATRRDRVREGVLLKTLGATRHQVNRILLAEYALLGVLGSLTGVLLSIGAAWALSRFVFETRFVPALAPALLVSVGMTLLAIAIGALTGREVFRSTPMAALREV